MIYQVDSPYGALKSFMDGLIQGFQEMDLEVSVVDFTQRDAMTKLADCITSDCDAVLSFNCNVSRMKLKDGSYLQDHIHAPYYYFLLDHPMHHHRILKEPLKNFHAICVDKSFIGYIKKYYPHIKTVHMLPHGGMTDEKWIPWREREIDVLFTGSYKPTGQLLDLMEQSEEPAKTLSLALVRELLDHPEGGLSQQEAFSRVLQKLGFSLTDDQYAEWLCVIGNLADHYIRGIYRNKLLEMMAHRDYQVWVYGEGWEECPIQASNIHYHKAVDYEENISLMNHSKIVFNTYTGFLCGAHERIFTAMLAKALCFTDSNQYIEENLTDRGNCIFFSYQDMVPCSDQINYYLQHQEEAEKIALNGYRYADKYHTWKVRARQIREIMEQEMC
jgi:glycosyltransferase involved in cell wall biosynthesis